MVLTVRFGFFWVASSMSYAWWLSGVSG